MKRAVLITCAVSLPLLALAAFEVTLRACCGRPAGYFRFVDTRNVVPGAVVDMTWGPIPYRVKFNSMGLRGDEVAMQKPSGTTRILAIGDSITNGYFVDDEDTYPHRLAELLKARGVRAEVVNGSLGGGSIDTEFSALRRLAPLKPDVVILTFVTNDIAEIWSRSRAELIQGSAPSMASRFATQMIQHSAVAELSFDTILKTRFASYRASDRAAAASPAATRTDFTGGDRFDDNVREFEQRYAGTDGLVLRDDWSADTSRHVDDYLYALAAVRDFCAQQGSTLLLVYFPAYSQVYGHASRRINDTLASRSRELGIRFLDLTGTFREKGRGAVLHLTPVDYHLNPAGNVVLAAAIGEFLLGAHLLGA